MVSMYSNRTEIYLCWLCGFRRVHKFYLKWNETISVYKCFGIDFELIFFILTSICKRICMKCIVCVPFTLKFFCHLFFCVIHLIFKLQIITSLWFVCVFFCSVFVCVFFFKSFVSISLSLNGEREFLHG